MRVGNCISSPPYKRPARWGWRIAVRRWRESHKRWYFGSLASLLKPRLLLKREYRSESGLAYWLNQPDS